MLQQVFLNIFDMSITAGYCVIFVIIIRFFMRRLPRSYSYILWMVVFVRLLIPSLPESDWSLIPRIPFAGQEQLQKEQDMSVHGHSMEDTIEIQEDIFPKGEILQNNMPAFDMTYTSDSAVFESPSQILSEENVLSRIADETTFTKVEPLQISSLIWGAVAIALIVYSAINNTFFRKRLEGAERVAPYTYEVDGLQTAFITGVLKTRIYLPANLSEEYRRYVIAHEQMHRKRGDNLIKYVAFILTCIHWFNPLVWMAFYFMCRDMEMSCDERVLRTLGMEEKKAYSMALLSVASGRKLQLGMPIAFSETSTKSRIRNVLKYRRPKFWAACAASAVIVAVMAGLLSNPSEQVVSAGTEPEQDSQNTAQSPETEVQETEGGEEDVIWDKTFLYYVIPEEIDGKKVITLGLPCGSEDIYKSMQEIVTKYNEQSKDYYIEIISFTDDWQKLESSQGEIMKALKRGDGTDILYLSGLEKEELAMSGVLTDLKAFMTEEDWNQIYVGNILEATTIGDKLYAIGPEFAICTLMADERLMTEDAGWTMEELCQYLEGQENGAHSFTSITADESDAKSIGNLVIDDFVDWENLSCSFETEEFYKLLELCKEKETTENTKKTKSLFSEDIETVKQEVHFGLITDVHDYQTYNIMYDECVQSKGFPTANGSGVAAIMYDGMGISSHSANKEAAWDFIEFYLTERDSYHAFPILQERLYAAYEEAKTPEYAGNQEIPKSYFLKIYTYAATNTDVQAVADIIAQADREYHYNNTYSKILEEEVVTYYRDKISVEETASRIEERMNEYLAEFK